MVIQQIPFGPGLDKESGSLIVQPNRMQDLRNVYHHEGSLVVRKGVEKTVDFFDFVATTTPATHVLMGIAIRSEQAGIVVTFEETLRKVTVHRVDALGTTATAIGHWEWREGTVVWPGTDIPKVILAEIYGTVYMAHDDSFAARRANTYVYDPFFGPGQLTPLKAVLTRQHDLTAEEAHIDPDTEAVRFRGVVRHLAYLFGWGWGNSGPEGIRPEMLRSSYPGEPRRFDPDHYWIVGDRRDPIVSAAPARQTLLVAKETETHQIVGYSRQTFGQRPYDHLYGCLGGRLMVSVSGKVFMWSSQGPMVGTDGSDGWEKIWLPLDLGGFEPATLVERIAFEEGWSDYIDEVEIVIFGFGKRCYCLSVRNPADPRWTYWELGRKAFCGFRLYGSKSGSVTGTAEINGLADEHDAGCGPTSIVVTVDNDGQSGEEFIEPWYRVEGPRFIGAPNRAVDGFDKDADDDGVADNWTAVDGTTANVAIFSLNAGASGDEARILVRDDLTGAGDCDLRWRDNGITVGLLYRLEVEMKTLEATNEEIGALTIENYIGIEFFDVTDVSQGTVFVQWQDHEFYKVFAELVAPATSTYAEVILRVNSSVFATGDTSFRNVRFYEDQGTSIWRKASIGEPGVPVSSEVIQVLPPFAVDEPGTGFDVAVRYVSAAGVPGAGYTDPDPTMWPAASQDSIIVGLAEPVLLGYRDGVAPGLGPYQEIYIGCSGGRDRTVHAPDDDGPFAVVQRYANRDIEIEQDAVSFAKICRGNTYFRRYLADAIGVLSLDEFNAWRGKYLGPQVNSALGAPAEFFTGPFFWHRPSFLSLESTVTDNYTVQVNTVGDGIPFHSPYSSGNYYVIGLEIWDDGPAGTGTFVRRFQSATGASNFFPADPFSHTEGGAGGTTITVKARIIYYPLADQLFVYERLLLGVIYGPFIEQDIAITA